MVTMDASPAQPAPSALGTPAVPAAAPASAPWWSTTRGDLFLAGTDALLVSSTALTGVGVLSWGQAHSPWLPMALAVPGLLGVSLRHRRLAWAVALIGASTVATAALGHSVAAFVLLFEFFFTLTLLGSERVRAATRVLACALTAAFVVATVVSGGGLGQALTAALGGALCLGLPVAWASDLRVSDRLRAVEARRADEAAASAAAHTELALVRERTRMAGELHDSVSGHLSAIALQSQAALSASDPAVRDAVLGQIRSASVEALAHMRSLIDVLHAGGQQAEPLGTLADLPALAERARAAGHQVTLRVSEPLPGLSRAAEAAAFRAASEGVTNALKHAPRRAVELVVGPVPGGLELRVANRGAPSGGPGVGGPDHQHPLPDAAGSGAAATPPGGGNGLGLRQLAARLDSVGGTLRAGPEAEGWVLSARVPTLEEEAS